MKLIVVVVVAQLDRDGLLDLNVQADWQKKGGTYWMQYAHVEIIGFSSSVVSMYHFDR